MNTFRNLNCLEQNLSGPVDEMKQKTPFCFDVNIKNIASDFLFIYFHHKMFSFSFSYKNHFIHDLSVLTSKYIV